MPIAEPLFSQDAQPETRPEKREKPLQVQGCKHLRGRKDPQLGPDPPVIICRGIYLLHDPLIPLGQRLHPHPGQNIGGAVHIIAGKGPDHPTEALKPVKQAGSGRCLKHPHHGHDDPAVLDKIDLALENRGAGHCQNPQ